MKKRRILDYEGREVVIRYEVRRCIHAAECIAGLPGVFEKDRRPWIDPDQATPQAIFEVIARCPTGALRAERQDHQARESEPHRNTARIAENGPIYLEGKLRLQWADDESSTETRMALCRCGDSQNKPFCDNSHLAAGFADQGVLGAAMMAPLSDDLAEPLVLSMAKNGPIVFAGPCEVIGADGAEPQAGSKGALCRCGVSQNKPYCDGSHAASNFESD